MNYLLGVCGSVSAYKSYDILRGLIKQGHQVKVVLTKGAEHFVQAQMFEYLGATAVFCALDDFTTKEKTILHIDLANWLERLVIAPASANTMAKLSHGICDDLLSSIFLCCEKKDKILFPAMNTKMYENSISKINRQNLQALERLFVHPPQSTGLLACGEKGAGKLPLPEDILDFLEVFQFKSSSQKVLITTGATVAPLDPVRYLTNPASGKTGIALARTFLSEGCTVNLIAGYGVQIPAGLLAHPNLSVAHAQTTDDMAKQVEQYFDQTDIYISAAALSDIKFKTHTKKIKKADSLSLDYEWGVDVLAQMLARRKNQKIVGFAAETDLSPSNILSKLNRKPVDLLITNYVHNGMQGQRVGFGEEANHYQIVQAGNIQEPQYWTKPELAQEIYRRLQDD